MDNKGISNRLNYGTTFSPAFSSALEPTASAYGRAGPCLPRGATFTGKS